MLLHVDSKGLRRHDSELLVQADGTMHMLVFSLVVASGIIPAHRGRADLPVFDVELGLFGLNDPCNAL